MKTVKDFLTKFPICPRCKSDFDLKGTRIIIDNVIGVDLYNANIKDNKLNLALYPTDPISFVDSDIEFSIDLESYTVNCLNERKFKNFAIDVGSFSVSLKIGCSNCAPGTYIPIGFEHGFGAFFLLDYNVEQHDFSNAALVMAGFSYENKGVVYHIVCFHGAGNHTWIGRHTINIEDGKDYVGTKTDLLDIGIFDFSTAEKIMDKINKILVLA